MNLNYLLCGKFEGPTLTKIGYKNAPIEHRFSATNPAPRHTKKHPNGYLTPILKRFLNKTINYQDPETQKMIKGKVKDAILWRLLLNGAQGDNQAIKEIIDRIDGKSKDKIEHSGEINTGEKKIIIIRPQIKKEELIGSKAKELSR